MEFMIVVKKVWAYRLDKIRDDDVRGLCQHLSDLVSAAGEVSNVHSIFGDEITNTIIDKIERAIKTDENATLNDTKVLCTIRDILAICRYCES